ncbi:MAG: GNAT family N-acetyltransferase [Chthoniobacterales bacterium]
MKFEIISASEVSLADQAAAFNAAFAGYVGGNFELNAATLASFISLQGIDLTYSRFARDEHGQLVSFGFINKTGSVSRLAGMGTIAAARRSGVAAAILSQLLAEAKERSESVMVLEVIEQNPPALKLYESAGFTRVTRLLGWRGSSDDAHAAQVKSRELSMFEALQTPTTPEYPALPWPVCRFSAAKVRGAKAFGLEDTAIVLGDTDVSPIRLHAFFGLDGTNWESVRNLTASVLRRFPGREFYAPPIFPEEFAAPLFTPLGFRKEQLSQFFMRKDV